jgi:hypothetical protein
MYCALSFGPAFIRRTESTAFFFEELDVESFFCLQELKTNNSMSICSIFAFFIKIISVVL